MRHLNSLTLKVQLSAGVDIQEACCDICELASRVGCLVEAKFNDVLLWAVAGDNPLRIVASYEKEIASSKTVKIAKSW